MEIRSRHKSDLAPLAAAIEDSNRDDRWPPHWPSFGDGFRLDRYLGSGDEVAAFVAVHADSAVGHIALHRSAAIGVVDLASNSLERPSSELAFVARMYVVPHARRHGVAAELLTRVANHARDLGRSAVLDVWDQRGPANSIYEACGWREVGRVAIAFGSPGSSRCAHGDGGINALVRAAPK